MAGLHRISDANLISARYHGIELDAEGACESLASCVAGAVHLPGGARDAGELLGLEKTFREILLHAWPEPDDPAVEELLAWARAGLAHARRVAGWRPG